MADAAPILNAHVISELRKLDGRAKVTYPYGDVDFPTIERVLRVLQADKEKPFVEADEEYPQCSLVAQQQVASDDQYVYVYRKWEVIPGPEVATVSYTETGEVVTTIHQKVAAGTTPTADGLNVIESRVTDSDELVAEKTTATVPGYNTLGGTLYDARGGKIARSHVPVAPGNTPPDRTLNIVKVEQIDQSATKAILEVDTVATHPPLSEHKQLPGGRLLKRTSDIVAPGTLPAGGTLVMSDRVAWLDAFESEEFKETIVKADGTALSDDTGYTLERWDPITKVTIYTTFTLVPYGTAKPQIGTLYPTGATATTVTEAETKEIDDSDKIMLIVEWTSVPLPRSEERKSGFQFPAVALISETLSVPSNYAGRYPPPWPGDGVRANTYRIYPHRNLTRPAKVIYTYHLGKALVLARGYSVLSPGNGSKIFPIPGNCIHPPVTLTETSDSGTFIVEEFPKSTPDSYDPDKILVNGGAEQRVWKGNIWETEIELISENLSPGQFPVYLEASIFVATQQNDILSQPATGQLLYIQSSSGAENTVVTIYGRRKGVLAKSRVTVAGTTLMFTAGQKFDRVIQVRAHTAETGTISVRGSGTVASGSVEFTALPNDGDTLVIGKTAATVTYTFRTPGGGTITCVAKALYVTGAVAADYCAATINAVEHRYWFKTDGLVTAPAAAGSGTVNMVDVSDAGVVTATAVGALLATAIAATITGATFGASALTGVVTVAAVPLGTFALAETVANAGFTVATAVGGTALAANQIRTLKTITGAAATIANMATWLAAALGLTGTPGNDYSAATSIHPSMTGTVNGLNGALVRVDDKTDAPPSQTWVLTRTGTAMTLVPIVISANGPLIATLNPALAAPYKQNAFRDVIFNNPDLINGNPDAAIENVPATVNVTSDSLTTPVTTGAYLQVSAAGLPALPISYETSQNNSTWSAGAVTLDAIGNGAVYTVPLSESNLKYIRIKVDNSAGEEARAVHAAFVWPAA